MVVIVLLAVVACNVGARRAPERERMKNAAELDYRWGPERDGVEIGLWASRASVKVGEPVDLRAAARNVSASAASVDAMLILVIESGGTRIEDASGPRSSEPFLVPPHGQVDLLGWRLSQEQLGTAPGARKIWVRRRGDAAPLSGVIELDVVR